MHLKISSLKIPSANISVSWLSSHIYTLSVISIVDPWLFYEFCHKHSLVVHDKHLACHCLGVQTGPVNSTNSFVLKYKIVESTQSWLVMKYHIFYWMALLSTCKGKYADTLCCRLWKLLNFILHHKCTPRFFLAGNHPSETAEVESKLEEYFCPLLDKEFAAPWG
jgi:hypothetical protein